MSESDETVETVGSQRNNKRPTTVELCRQLLRVRARHEYLLEEVTNRKNRLIEDIDTNFIREHNLTARFVRGEIDARAFKEGMKILWKGEERLRKELQILEGCLEDHEREEKDDGSYF